MGFKFSVGPWNVSEGADRFGPPVRDSIPILEKIERFKRMGFDAVQFHDDDIVTEINKNSEKEVIEKAKEFKKELDSIGIATEFIGPRLWEDPKTIDGAFTSNNPEDRDYAKWRAFRAVDIAKVLGCNKIVLWPAREGTVCYESKNPIEAINRFVEGMNSILNYDKEIMILIEHKPNEPVDRAFFPTIGHSIALGYKTVDPDRVGALLETAHAVLAGLDPANEIAFGLAYKKLWSVHLNDQNGLKYDQDKAFGVENLRQAFNQVKVLIENEYDKSGNYVGLDVQAMRTQKIEESYMAVGNSLKIFKMLEAKARKFNYGYQKKCVEERNYEALEMYVMELLMKS